MHVILAYVVPGWRRQGVHTAMWNALVAKAVELKRPVIESGTSIDNAVARAAMRAQARVETSIITRFHVPGV